MNASPDPVRALDRMLEEAHEEVQALQACLAEQFEHIAELEDERAALVGKLPAPKLAGGMVRDAARALQRFTFSELRSELGSFSGPEIRKFFKPMLLGETIVEIGRVGRAPFYEYRRPEGDVPTHHPTARPPEKDPPALTESRATGMPVRVEAVRKLTRRGRSTPGTSHRHKQRDARYERAQAVRAERAEAAKSKAQKEPKWKRQK